MWSQGGAGLSGNETPEQLDAAIITSFFDSILDSSGYNDKKKNLDDKLVDFNRTRTWWPRRLSRKWIPRFRISWFRWWGSEGSCGRSLWNEDTDDTYGTRKIGVHDRTLEEVRLKKYPRGGIKIKRDEIKRWIKAPWSRYYSQKW